MAESEKVILEVYAAPTFSLFSPVHIKGGVIGDDITYTVTASAVGGWTGSVTIELADAPTGAVVTYVPNPPSLSGGESAVITVNTDACSAGETVMTIQEA